MAGAKTAWWRNRESRAGTDGRGRRAQTWLGVETPGVQDFQSRGCKTSNQEEVQALSITSRLTPPGERWRFRVRQGPDPESGRRVQSGRPLGRGGGIWRERQTWGP